MDGRADAYSLACAAFEMLAGEPPFRREQSLAVMWAQLSAPPPPLTSMRRDLPPAVDQVMARGLAKPPEDRYPSCRAFAAALQEACGVSAGELAAPALAAQELVPPPPGGPDSAPTDPGGSRPAAPDRRPGDRRPGAGNSGQPGGRVPGPPRPAAADQRRPARPGLLGQRGRPRPGPAGRGRPVPPGLLGRR